MSHLIRIDPNSESTDFTALTKQIANGEDVNFRDYNVYFIPSVVTAYREEIINYIIDKGLATLVNSQPLTEELVSKGAATNYIIKVIHKYLDKIMIDNELIIVDPYFFAPTSDSNYANIVVQVLDKYLSVVSKLIVITLTNKVDVQLKDNIRRALNSKYSTLQIVHNTSNDFHDRFWISSNREKGIITGTSLNGLGKKYALIDRLNKSDVREIVASLTSKGLI